MKKIITEGPGRGARAWYVYTTKTPPPTRCIGFTHGLGRGVY